MKVKDDTTRGSMFKWLGDIMHTKKEYSAIEEANKFLNDFQEETSFVEYFRAWWLDKIGLAIDYNML